MANSQDYSNAFGAVKAGTASAEQVRLTEKAASQAGSTGNVARDALKSLGNK